MAYICRVVILSLHHEEYILRFMPVFFITIFCQAQFGLKNIINFKNLSIRNGLSQNTVNAILQDRKGFMWLGTKDGLNRYDGLSFRKFKHDAANPRSIGNSFITSLYEDFNGNIWVGTDAGVYITI